MNPLQDLGSWGSGILGQAHSQLAPAAAAATHIVKSGAKAVKSSIKDNIGAFGNVTHNFEGRSVTEVCLIAEGGFGSVSRVRDTKTGAEYALKTIRCAEGAQVTATLAEAKLEAEVLQRLPPHPHIIQCFGFAMEASVGGNQLVKLLLELCPGGHLLDFMDKSGGRLSPKEVIVPFAQIVDAVHHLHSQSPPIQHRDLKVENVLQDASGRWKLCDFGSCSTESVPAQELPRGKLMKLQDEIDKTVTILYRPPELADIALNFRKGYAITEQVDMWMLGCILYTLAFYRHPFQDNATAMAICNAKYFIPEDSPSSRATKLCSIIHWLLAADPKDRPTSERLRGLLREVSKYSYENLLEIMPCAVTKKIRVSQALYSSRTTPLVNGGAANSTPSAQLPASRCAASTACTDDSRNQFDICFALAENPDEHVSSSGQAAAVPATSGPSEDLLSLGPEASSHETASAHVNSGFDDLLGWNLAAAPSASPVLSWEGDSRMHEGEGSDLLGFTATAAAPAEASGVGGAGGSAAHLAATPASPNCATSGFGGLGGIGGHNRPAASGGFSIAAEGIGGLGTHFGSATTGFASQDAVRSSAIGTLCAPASTGPNMAVNGNAFAGCDFADFSSAPPPPTSGANANWGAAFASTHCSTPSPQIACSRAARAAEPPHAFASNPGPSTNLLDLL